MPANPVAENVLGTIGENDLRRDGITTVDHIHHNVPTSSSTPGTVCWTIQLVPQIWKSWRSKSTEGLSEYLMLLWGLSGIFFGVYAIVQDINVPLIVQPQVLSALSYLSWAQCQYYGRKRSLRTVVLMYLAVILLSGGFEAGMIFAVQPSYNRGNKGPIDFFGAFSTVLLSVALLPQYYEIYKHKEVIGVSILFMIVDMTGGIFSDLSLAFKVKFDVVASVTYSLVIVLDAVVVLCAIILNPMAKRRRKRLQALAGEDGVQRASGEQPGLSMQDIEAPQTSETGRRIVNGEALATMGGVGGGHGA